MDTFVALGGNLGPVKERMEEAISLLTNNPGIFDLRRSRFYCTQPVSAIVQPNYLNACCHFRCTLSPFKLISCLQKIEERLGKVPKLRDHPRPIDLDLLFMGEKTVWSEKLVLPHPRWHERFFVLRPLRDLVRFLPFGIDLDSLLERFDVDRLWTLCD